MKEKWDAAYRKIVNAWCMYDWGSSAFSTTIESAVLPVYFGMISEGYLAPNVATAYWGWGNSLALLLTALLAPILGSIADYTASKKKYLAIFATIGIAATALMFFLNTGDWLMAIVLFFFGSVGLGSSYVFYDALLPHVAKPEDIDYVSAKGYALGYLGGGLLLALNILFIMKLTANNLGYRLSFLSVAIWWAIFTIPLMRHVPEPPASTEGIAEGTHPVRAGFQRVAQTFRHIRRYSELFKFLVAFWLYNDGIGTIIKMAVKYGDELGISALDLIGALLATQFVGIPFSLAFGKFSKKVGTKRSIMIGLAWYALITVGGYFMSKGWHFWVLAIAVGMVQGGTQALSRSLFGAMAPKYRSAEFFGFYDISSKFAGIVGPALFAILSLAFGQSRFGILAIGLFFLGGIYLLTLVDEEKGMRIAEEENRRMEAKLAADA